MGKTSDTTELEAVTTTGFIPKQCCIKSGGKCGCAKAKLPNRDDKLKGFLAQYDQKDLRFVYRKSRMCPNIKITVVSVLSKDKTTLKVAFAFNSPKDSFCKASGKIKCFERLALSEHPYVITVPWLNDGLLSIYHAYNNLKQRPEKLANSRFDDLIPVNTPRYTVIQYC